MTLERSKHIYYTDIGNLRETQMSRLVESVARTELSKSSIGDQK